MSKDYKAISEEEMLNFEDANTAQIARYARIMQHRSSEATVQLAKQMQSVAKRIYTASQAAQENAREFANKVDEAIAKADEAIASANAAALEQRRQQRSMKALTAALLVATVAYTIINAVSVLQAYRGNQIQAAIASAARDQVVVAREANELQRSSSQRSLPAGAGAPDAPRRVSSPPK
jgi:hypothetical protein